METIQKVVYNYLKNDVTIQANSNGFFYLINDNKVKSPYYTIFSIDDPMDIENLCVSEQGQTRFQCDTFATTFVKGIDKRAIFQNVITDLANTTSLEINIFAIELLNQADRPDTINSLFQFSFECIVHWEKK